MKNLTKTFYFWGITKFIFSITWWFWVLETSIFLLKYGWHTKATTEDEIICDKIVTYGFTIGVVLMANVVADVLNYLLREVEE